MAGGVRRDRRVAVDRVPADEVARVDHAVRVRARALAVDAERAEDRRRRRLARRHVVDPLRPAVVREHEHLARHVGLDVLAGARVLQPEGAAALEHLLEDVRARVADARHVVHLAEGQHRARGAGPVVAARLEAGVAEPLQAALEHRHPDAARADARGVVEHARRLARGEAPLLARGLVQRLDV